MTRQNSIRKLIAAVAVVTAGAIGGVGVARAQTITLVNDVGMRPARLVQVERALAIQAEQLRRWWGTPEVTFAAGGWPLVIARDPVPMCANLGWGCHGVAFAMPYAITNANTIRISHELLEMLGDPYGGQLEVCDPVEDGSYRLAGVHVSDFVRPSGVDEAGLFTRSAGAYDWRSAPVHSPSGIAHGGN